MTLLESLITVAVISVTAVVAVPSLLRARESYALDAAARQVAGHLQSARIKAISRNRDCRLRVTSPASYAVECEDPVWRTDESVVLRAGFRITANATPQFHRRGNASPSATIAVSNALGRTKRIIVNITGRIRLE
jgi:type II secretory pathway pseudopilin PulG